MGGTSLPVAVVGGLVDHDELRAGFLLGLRRALPKNRQILMLRAERKTLISKVARIHLGTLRDANIMVGSLVERGDP